MDDLHQRPIVQIGTARVDFANLKIEGPAGQYAIEPLVMAVLAVLCETPEKTISRDDLIDRVWGVSHGGDERLTRAISLLRKAFGDERGHHTHIETVPKVGYRLIAAVDPEITGKDQPANGLHDPLARKVGSGSRNKQALAIAGVLFVLLAVGWNWIVHSPKTNEQTERKSIAVLPFEPLSSGEDDTYFADGFTLELNNSLAALGDLRVTGSSSSFALKDSPLRIDEISQLLGVEYVVAGSVRLVGDKVRVTAELVRAADQSTLWASAYDRPIQGTIDIQSEMASRIAETLNVVLDDNKLEAMERAGLKNVEAFIAYQKGSLLQIQAHGELPQIATLTLANKFYDEATDRVPSYWPAHFFKIDLYTHILLDRAAGETQSTISQDLIESAKRNFDTALSRAHATARNEAELANVKTIAALFSSDWTDIGKHMREVLQFNGCIGEQWMQVPTIPFEPTKEVLDFFLRQTSCDPLDGVPWNNAAMAALYLGNPDKALEILDLAESKRAPNILLQRTRFEALLANENYADAKRLAQYFPERMRLAEQIGLHAAQGDSERASKTAAQLYELSNTLEHDSNPAPIGNLSDALILAIAPLIGDRTGANEAASRIDARPYGPTRLAEAVLLCFCGAPFDLEVTPNFAERIEEAELPWPPYSPITYPLKDW